MKRLQKVTKKLARGIGTILKKGIQGATVALLAFGAAAAKVIQIGATFEKTLVTAAVKFPGKIRQGSEAFKALEDAARKTGAQTEFTATQAAEGLNFLAMAGFDAKQAIAALPGVVNLATAAAVELAEASDMATDTLGAMGLMTKDTTKLTLNLARVNDVMAATTTSANTNMEQMFEAIKAGGPTVTAAGQSIETFSALVGVMAGSGLKAEKAGTTLRNMFLRLQAPVGAAKGLIKKYAGNIIDSKGDMIDIVEIMRRFETSMGKLGKAQKAQILATIFGKRAITGSLVVLQAGADNIDDYRKSLEDATGASDEMASVIRDTTMGSIDALKSVIESVIIDLFKLEDKGIKKTVDGMVKWVRENKKLIAQKVGKFLKDLIQKLKDFKKWADNVKLIDKMKRAFELLGDALAFVVEHFDAIAGVAVVIGGIALAVEGLTLAIGALNLITAANPIVLLATIIAASILRIIQKWDDFVFLFREAKELFKDIWDSIKDSFDNGIGLIIAGPIGWLILAYKEIKKAWDPSKGFFENMWNGIVATFKSAWDRIKKFAGPIINVAKTILGLTDDMADKTKPKTVTGVTGYLGFKEPGTTVDPQLVSPGDRTARSIEENNSTTTSKSEVTIKDDTGRAEVTSGELGTGLSMEPSGAF